MCLAQSLHTFRVFIPFFNFSLLYIIFMSYPSRFLDNAFYLKYIWVKRIKSSLKGKFPQTTMRIGWGESNFRNPTVKVWADLDYPFKRSDYAKLCMSPSLDGTRPEYVISQEDNSPLTLYIDFHNFLDINSPFDQIHS